MASEQRAPSDGTPLPDFNDGVLPAVVRSRSDGSERFICYAPDADVADVDDQWLSVDADLPVSLLVMR